MARRKIFPIPVEAIIDNPAFIALPVAGRGMLFTLILHYWMTECRPLPKNEVDLRHVMRAHGSSWARNKTEILKLFKECQTDLDRENAYRTKNLKHLQALAERMNAARRLRAMNDKRVKRIAPEERVVARETERREKTPPPGGPKISPSRDRG